MINGYVNLPEELQDFSEYGTTKVVKGIYAKIVTMYKLKKPVVGKAIVNETELATTWAIAYIGQGEYAIRGLAGDYKLELTVNYTDQVVAKISYD